MPDDRPGYRISILDEDPLRARKEARELLAAIADDPGAVLDVPGHRTPGGTDKGGLSVDTIGVVISAGSLVAAGVQIWLARVPQRTIVVKRPDGATLHIAGKEAREDDERIERFLAGGTGHAHDAGGRAPGDNADGDGNGTATG
ncbi:effector-associated constant component EACC1 [Streptomyces sp. 8N706]|uniref:effector-associated constant component EACC1 n=1 Tax=Streptomyces sp. 8N706 TaxID=3457416 RepID=UPI003FD20D47